MKLASILLSLILLFSASDWTAKTTDNVCGLNSLNQVSNPAIVQYQDCINSTPEMIKIVKDKIDLSSPEGIKLLTDATNKVISGCETVRASNNYCSVWRAIKHKDGRSIPDITEKVKGEYCVR